MTNVNEFASGVGLNPSRPFSWIPEDGALCSLPVGASLTDWSYSDVTFFGSGGGLPCADCPFSASNSADGVGKCAGAAIIDNNGAGHWFGFFGGLSAVERAEIAESYGFDVPGWVDGGVEAQDGRHGTAGMWSTCKCEACKVGRSTWRKVNESRNRSKEQLDRRAEAKRERYADLRSQGYSRAEARRMA